MINQLIRYFLSGLAIVIPIWFTFYILYQLISWVDGLLGIGIPGMGLVIVLIVIVNIGVLATVFIGKPLFAWLDRMLRSIPFVATVYNAIKEVTDALMGDKKKFDKPVLMELQEGGIYRLGYVTQQTVVFQEIKAGPLVAVYFPHSYNFSGNVYLVHPSKLKSVHHKSGEVMKFIVSGGIVNEMIGGDGSKR